jgi:hypothetical protein
MQVLAYAPELDLPNLAMRDFQLLIVALVAVRLKMT